MIKLSSLSCLRSFAAFLVVPVNAACGKLMQRFCPPPPLPPSPLVLLTVCGSSGGACVGLLRECSCLGVQVDIGPYLASCCPWVSAYASAVACIYFAGWRGYEFTENSFVHWFANDNLGQR